VREHGCYQVAAHASSAPAFFLAGKNLRTCIFPRIVLEQDELAYQI
jgi:hypothetical protein